MSATGFVGEVTIDIVLEVPVTGVEGTGQVGSVLVWGGIVPNQDPSYTPTNPSQSPSWGDETPTQTSGFAPTTPTQSPGWADESVSQSPGWTRKAA